MERGWMIDFDAGILYIQTFKKLPMHKPKIKTGISMREFSICDFIQFQLWVQLRCDLKHLLTYRNNAQKNQD